MSDDVITLKGMRFQVRVGILPHEYELAQPIEIDIVATCARPREGVVDYSRLYAAASAAASLPHTRYLEEVADAVANDALAITGVISVSVAVRKPHAALGGPLDYAEVSVERTINA